MGGTSASFVVYSSIFPLHRAISFSQSRCLDSVFSVARCERCASQEGHDTEYTSAVTVPDLKIVELFPDIVETKAVYRLPYIQL